MNLRRLITALCVVVFAFFVNSSAQEVPVENVDEVVRVDTSLVMLNATIRDKKGMPVNGLDRKLFRVLEDGVEQEIELFETRELPFAAVVLIDTSGSMEERLTIARSATIDFIQGIRRTDSVAVYSFDHEPKLLQEFSSLAYISDSIFDIRARGVTALNDAIYKAAEELAKRPEKRRAIIVLSDGADTGSGRSASAALKAALAADATIFTVDLTSMAGRERMQNRNVLRNFAEKSGGTFISVRDARVFRDSLKGIVEELGNQYTLGYSSTNTKKDGTWRAIELVVKRPNLTIRTREGYNAEKR